MKTLLDCDREEVGDESPAQRRRDYHGQTQQLVA